MRHALTLIWLVTFPFMGAAQFASPAIWRTIPSSPLLDTSGVAVWLDAIDSSTVIRDASGYVSLWQDKSPRGNYYRQYNAGAQPRFRSDSLGGRAAVVFDGTSDFLVMQNKLRLTSSFTIYVIQRTMKDCFLFADSAVNTQLRYGTGNQLRMSSYDGYDLATPIMAQSRTIPTVIAWVYSRETFTMLYYQFDASKRRAVPYGPVIHYGMFGVGYFGRPFQGAFVPMSGPIGSVMIFGEAHWPLRVEQTAKYLMERWGL